MPARASRRKIDSLSRQRLDTQVFQGPCNVSRGTLGNERSTCQPSGLGRIGLTVSGSAHPNCHAEFSRGFALS